MSEAMGTALALCQRCSALCAWNGDRNPDAQVLRRSAVPEGLCASCATTAWLKATEPIASTLSRRGPEILLHPGLRDHFAAVLESGNADADISEIDWDAIVKNWELPMPKARRGR